MNTCYAIAYLEMRGELCCLRGIRFASEGAGSITVSTKFIVADLMVSQAPTYEEARHLCHSGLLQWRPELAPFVEDR